MRKVSLRLTTLFLIVLSLGGLGAQSPADTKAVPGKLSPIARERLAEKAGGEVLCYLRVDDLADFRKKLGQRGIKSTVIRKVYPRWNGILLNLSYADIGDWVSRDENVLFVDVREGKPQPERAVRGLDLSVNALNVVHQRFPNVDGRMRIVSVKENAFDSTDIDFSNRYRSSPLRDRFVTTHATIMATLVGGGGNSFYTGKGAAPEVELSSTTFNDVFPDPDEYFLAENIGVQNHSYGLGIENYYGGEAMAYDDQSYRLPTLLHVYSAGNQGDIISDNGPYAGIPGFANLTGNMKMGKNVITVGAIDTALQLAALSSRGPAYDGRIKPELVAAGEDGSSGAAALTSGTAALLQQVYFEVNESLPPNALLRAALLNSADDLGTPGPDYGTGFGNLDAWGAVNTIKEERYWLAGLSQGEDRRFSISVPSGTRRLKVMLAWTDPSTLTNAERALVNDLDLTVSSSGSTWLPWVLSSFPDEDSLALPAVRKTDRLNNQEQITIDFPAEGVYDITVRGFELATPRQSFALAYEWDTVGFDWRFPLREDPVIAGALRTLRWAATGIDQATIQYRSLNEPSWETVVETDASKPLYSWTIPDEVGLAQLRAVTETDTFYSDTFVVSRPLDLEVEFDCTEDILLRWSEEGAAMEYELLGFTDGELQPLLSTSDTFAYLDKSTYPFEYYSVRPRLTSDRFGVNDRTINVAFQSAGCFLRGLFGSLRGDAVDLELRLGSTYELEGVVIEKRIDGSFIPLFTFDRPTALQLNGTDEALTRGPNVYRAVVVRNDGSRLVGNEITVTYIADPFFVYPNPTTAEIGAALVSEAWPPDAEFFLFASDGRLLSRFTLEDGVEEIPVQNLPPGPYYYRLFGGGEELTSGVLVVQ